jgi:serine protease AprX
MTRIIAYFMQEEERDAARNEMAVFQETESFLLGDAEDEDIPKLEDQGLIVERVEENPEDQAETPGAVSPSSLVSALAQGRSRESAFERDVAAEGPRIDFAGPNFYLIGLRGPLVEDWRQKFDELEVELLERVPPSNYTAKLTPEKVQRVDELPFVSGVRLYAPEDAVSVEMQRAAPPPPPGVERAILIYDARLHQAEDMEHVSRWLQDHGVSIAGTSKRKIRFYLPEDSPLMDEIAALPEIAEMEPYVRPVLHNDVARVLLGLDSDSQDEVAGNLPQTGEGQIVAVADTGLDEDHPDFQGRIVGIVALGRPGNYSDTHGHGTHVAGSVLGDGSASEGRIRGTAPRAQLFFQSLLDANGGLGGLPVDLGDLFDEAYQEGARIHNNSWGARTNAVYTFNSVEVDEFVAQHRDMLIVVAAGNEGRANNRVHANEGFVDWLSVSSPATSKNALTVGASRSSRTSGGYANLTFGQAWPNEFPEPPIANEMVSGDPEGLSGFSSRGPCDDHRIKPDIVAPGTNIVSAKSSRAPLREFWGAYPDNRRYAFMGGTSMATPLVAGCAALVREYYVSNRNHSPSAALLKATLINGTRWLTGSDSMADYPDLPNFHQGFGCVNMPSTIPNLSSPDLMLEFSDAWEDAEPRFVRTGQRFQFHFSNSGGDWMRICLTWTDLPQRALQNNLDLTVRHSQSGQKWAGNERLPLGITPLDVENNVEVVRIDNPPAGDYVIQVSATNLLGPPQDFALVVTGELGSSLTRL